MDKYTPDHCPICGERCSDTIVSIASHVFWRHVPAHLYSQCLCGWQVPNGTIGSANRVRCIQDHINSQPDPAAHLQEAWLILNSTP